MTDGRNAFQTEEQPVMVSETRAAEQVRSGLPPGPRHPKLLTVYLTAYRTKAFLDKAYKRYGDVFTVRLIYGKTLVFVADPALVEDVFTANPDVMIADKGATPILGVHSIVG